MLGKFVAKCRATLIAQYHGFRAQYFTQLALIDLVTSSPDKLAHTIGIFPDLPKALDTIDHNIISKLQTYGVRGTVLKWFNDYLRNRKQFLVWQNKKSNYKSITCGVP